MLVTAVFVQKWLAQTVTTATELGDLRYLNRADTYRNLLTIMSALAESFLREYLRRIASASRLNQKYQEMWQNTPEVGGTTFMLRACYQVCVVSAVPERAGLCKDHSIVL